MGSEEEFADTLSFGSGDTGRPGSLRHSRFTLYQSALDLQPDSAGITTPEEVRLFHGEPTRMPKGFRTMFRDGVRCVDFVLAWQDSGPNSPDRGETEAAKKRRIFEGHLTEDEGLELETETSDRTHFVKIHAPIEVLRRYAEILRLRMPMREVPGQEELIKNTADYDLMTEVKSLFAKLMDCLRMDTRLFPEDRFRLTAEYSRHKSYLFDERSPDFFSSQVRTLVVDFILERTCFSSEPASSMAVGIQKLISDDVYKAAYPLHDGSCEEGESLRCLLLKEWAQIKHWAKYQPIDQIREYFGVKYALYFAWLGFYTHMLVPASIVGLIVFLYGCITLYTDTLSRDICDESREIMMCPLCDRTCDYWRLSDTCSYARVNYIIDNPLTVVFAIFMSFWATLFLELWKRHSASIAHRWGLTDYCPQSEPPRAQYLGRVRQILKRRDGTKAARLRRDMVTGLPEPYVSYWRVRLPATILSFSIVILLIMVAVTAVFGVVLYRMSIFASLSLNADSDSMTTYAILVIPATAAIINLVCIMLLNWVYDKLAVYLTELELHRTQAEFDEALTLKIYLFQFVNYYTSIMYIAFLKGKFVGYPFKYNRIFGLRQEECSPGGCLMELCIQLAVIMVGQQAYNGLMEMLVPFVIKQLNGLKIKSGSVKETTANDLEGGSGDKVKLRSSTKQWIEDYKLLDWGPRGLFYEYLEMVMQYGFVTIFVTAFPLAPFFALLNNVFEMRLDAKKFLKFYRRPVPRRAPDIGVWFRILNVLGRLAVISNAFIIAFSSNFVPKLVYTLTVSEDKSDLGFLEHSLSLFNTSDFNPDLVPRSSVHNVSVCRYSQYREPPDVPDPSKKYKRGSMYWHVLAARLAFIVIFQNVVSLVTIAVQWCIPDVPAKLRDQIKKEAYLTNEIIIRHEMARAKNASDPLKTTADFVQREAATLRNRGVAARNNCYSDGLEEIELREQNFSPDCD